MAAELLRRLFESEIQDQLFPDGGFLSNSMSDDDYAGATNTVEIPNSGTIPAATVDRSVYPATVSQRNDVPHQYTMEEITTDPTHLPRHESLDPKGGRIAYNKRQSVMFQHSGVLTEKAEDRAIIKWLGQVSVANGNLLASTGTTRAAGGASQTGNRKGLAEADIKNAKVKLDKQNIPQEGRFLLVTADQHGDLLLIDRFTSAERIGQGGRIINGSVGKIYGFNVFVRSKTAVTDGSDALKAEGAVAAATDQDIAVFWHRGFVRKAKGAIHAYVRLNDPTYYGDIVSFGLMFGGVQARNDGAGVGAIFEDTV